MLEVQPKTGETYEWKESLLTIKDISLTLGDNLILSDVNAEIRDVIRPGRTQGQVVGLLGPSGIGKTQLLKILAGLQKPTTGTVTLNGFSEGVVQPGTIGVVFQHYPLFRWRTVFGNLIVAGKMAGLSKQAAKEKATTLLERFHLVERAHFYPAQLSGGQRQRVAIAQQLMCSEHFLIMDEPFSGLDPIMIDEVCKLITELANADDLNTIIVITHDLHAAVLVSDTLLLMGRDRDGDGNIIPGAKIQEQYDLIQLGLAWREDIAFTLEFGECIRKLRARFATL